MRTIFLVALLSIAPACEAQSTDLSGHDQLVLLTSARYRYYNPVSRGLRNYQCDVSIDWNATIASMTGSPLKGDDPLLLYLLQTKVHFKDALSETPGVTWENTATVPAGKEMAVNTLRSSFTAMISGFLQVWAPSLKGNLIPLSPAAVHIEPTGYLIEHQAGKQFDRISMNKEYTVQHVASRNSSITSEQDTTFTASPEGLLLTRLDDTYRQPATAPPIRFILDTTYAQVDDFRLPSTLNIEFPNAGKFKMSFVRCSVERQ